MRYCFTILMIVINVSLLEAQWDQVNVPDGGSISCITIFKNSIYVGTNRAGIYRSSDMGENWEFLEFGMTNMQINCLMVIDNMIYGGTSNGLIRMSSDDFTWSSANNGLLDRNIKKMYKSGSLIFLTTILYTYVSYDNGITWQILEREYRDIAEITGSENQLFSRTFNKLYQSANNGSSWTTVKQIPNNVQMKCIASIKSSLFVGTSTGIYYTNNEGNTWENRGLVKYDISTLLVSGTKLYAVGEFQRKGKIFCSSNNGASWDTLLSVSNKQKIRSLAVNGKYIYAAMNIAGILRSSDGGIVWSKQSTGIKEDKINNFFVDGSLMYSVTESEQLYKSSDHGKAWLSVDSINNLYDVTSMKVVNKNIFLCTRSHGVVRSINNGISWEKVNNGLPSLQAQYIASIDSTIYVSINRKGLFRSTDAGGNWNSVNSVFINKVIQGMLVDNYVLYVATNQEIYRSSDNGQTWFESKLNGVTFKAFTANQNSIAICNDEGVYISTGDTGNWRTSSQGLVSKTVNAIINIGQSLYIATNAGVYQSTNNGSNWQFLGLPDLKVHNLYTFKDTLYACAENTLWKTNINTIVHVDEEISLQTSALKFEIYPNPSNGRCEIKMDSIISETPIFLNIFTTEGEVVYQSVLNNKSSSLSINTLSTGMYFVVIYSGNNSSRQMLSIIN